MFRFSNILIIQLFLSVALSGCSSSTPNNDISPSEVTSETGTDIQESSILPNFSKLDNWHAGAMVDSMEIHAYGIDRCFAADTICDSIFAKMNNVTFHPDTPVRRTELRYLKILHYNAKGDILLGEMVCNRVIADELLEIFRELFIARYPIEHMQLAYRYGGDDESSMAANNTSCFNSRNIAGSSKPSFHAYGMAVDINPLYNPYVKEKNGTVVKLLPKNATYPDQESPYRIRKGDLCHSSFVKHGFRWGGSWRSVKDYQHFEKRK